MSAILNTLPATLIEIGHVDVMSHRDGISAEQLLRAMVVQRITGWGYDELAFQLQDSATMRKFCRLGPRDFFSAAMLEEVIQGVTEQNWKRVNDHLAAHGI